MRNFLIALTTAISLSLSLPAMAVNPNSLKMIEAAKLAVNGQYKQAIQLYTEVIATDADNIDAYLQRAIARRELGDKANMLSDATIVVRLADAFLAKRGQNGKLLYQRGNGYRLLSNYSAARRDIQAAVRLTKNQNWAMDLQAIELEEKMQSAK